MNNFIKWQNHDHPVKNRLLALIVGALIFPITIPLLLVFAAPMIDRSLGIGRFPQGWSSVAIGLLAIILGGILAGWTIAIQISLAAGTPFPMLPTKKLLVVGPFQYCRNPMTLGTIIAYAGVAILVGSVSACTAVFLLAAILVTYLKLVEEKELQLRFGSEYLEYKKKTPFIIPIKPGRKVSKRLI